MGQSNNSQSSFPTGCGTLDEQELLDAAGSYLPQLGTTDTITGTCTHLGLNTNFLANTQKNTITY